MSGFNDLHGQTFGRWLVLDIAGRNKWGNVTWRCRCQCGNEKIVAAGNLRKGSSLMCKSCGHSKPLSHGHAVGGKLTRTYRCWRTMMRRVTDPKNIGFHLYGGRGIRVCERWRSFPHFVEDMGEKPEGRTLDRHDNNGDYEPSNCRWATNWQQFRNKRNNNHITFDGRTMIAADWARELGIEQSSLNRRLRLWPLEAALTKPAKPDCRRNRVRSEGATQ